MSDYQNDGTETGHVPAQTDVIGSGQEGTLMDQVRAWAQRVRGGEMGALPAISGFVALTLLFTVLVGIFRPAQYFFTTGNFAALAQQAAPLIMLGMALVFVILLGEIDLSAGVTAGVTMGLFMVLVSRYGVNWMVALIVAFALGLAIGTLIGFFVARVGIPSFVVTLGLFLGIQGVQLILLTGTGSGNTSIPVQVPEVLAIQNANLPPWAGWVMLGVALAVSAATSFWDRYRRTRAGVANRTIALVWAKLTVIGVLGGGAVFLLNLNRGRAATQLGDQQIPGTIVEGVPMVVPFVLAVLWLGTFLLDRTRFGRYLYAIGGNAEAARRSGVKVVLIRWVAFIICSGLAVLAGLFTASRVGTVDAAMGRDLVLSGVAAAVVGGVSLFGGRGRLIHAAVGALVIAVITNGLGLLGLPSGVNYAVTGSVLILAATVDALSRRRAGGGVRT
jgi:D-xylose transport system permease protein